MTEPDRWRENNDRYLSAVLTWLRLRLDRFAPGESDSNRMARSVSEPPSPSIRDRLFGRSAAPLALPAASPDVVHDTRLKQAAQAVADAGSVDPPPAALILSQRFGLSSFEREVLLLCAALEMDTRIAALCAHVQGDPNRAYPTFALTMALFDNPVWDVLSPERPLRYWRLIEINQPGAQPLTASALRADERIVNYIKGLNYLDDRLAPLVTSLGGMDSMALPPSQQTVAGALVRELQFAARPVVQLAGPDSASKQTVARAAAVELDLHVYRMPVDLLPTSAGELETLVRLWQRESALLPIALYLDAHDADTRDSLASPLRRFVSRAQALTFVGTREVWPDLSGSGVTLDVDKPPPAEQQAAWVEALGSEHVADAAQLAGQFNLNIAEIHDVARVASADGTGETARVWRACLLRTRPRMDALAQRIDPKATWADIVLPEMEGRMLRQIAAQVRQRSRVYDEWGFRQKMNRGLGITALFAGESGTGKTMAAEVIANDLRLNLYRIDLSAVVSKYIGETEKNLRRMFDAAEDGGALLFFDEADALFGKRSEVKDSHDRYANIEINYLLQRMEAYRGLAILATNMKSALDTAFMRRLRFIVNFPFPGAAERAQMWRNVFPSNVPVVNLDFNRLARLNLTGGGIHNAAINATFLAAEADSAVSMPLIFDAARAEFRKLDRPINEAEFR